MRQPPDFFGDIELPLLYIAKKLREALRLEETLTEAGIDYAVEPDTYRGGIIFASERIGAFFYVAPQTLDEARQVLRGINYKPYDN
jgi:voltage-gated potassium channel Kch